MSIDVTKKMVHLLTVPRRKVHRCQLGFVVDVHKECGGEHNA